MKYAIELVEWVDSTGISGWESIKRIDKFEHSYCVSAGFLIKETKDFIAITNSLADLDTDYGAHDLTMVIPKVAIVSRKVLKKAK